MRVREFFKLSLLVVLAAVLIVGIALAGLLAFIGVTAQKQQTWNLSIGEISEALVEDETAPGEYHFSMQQVLDEDQLWAMLIGQDGEILWGYDLPDDLPERYSLTDVASFSRWYLRDYPVQVWVREDGLLVVGEPKGSTWKYAFSMDREILDLVPYWAGMVFFLALACVVGVSYLLLRLWFRSDQNKRDQARSDWINGISHDIRTPLSVVMGYASQMESDGRLGERQREQAGIIRRQSETIRSLVGDLNLTMRLDYEMQPLRRAPLSPAALIRQTAADFLNGGLDEKYSIEVQIDRSAQSLTLEADQFLLLRALANLVNNCIRHNPDGCAITLGVRSRGKECVLWVRNQIASGEDPRPQFRRRLQQQLLLQLPLLPQERGGLLPDGTAGHGTGLKLVEQIARAHNGRAVLRGGEGYFCCEVWLPL